MSSVPKALMPWTGATPPFTFTKFW